MALPVLETSGASVLSTAQTIDVPFPASIAADDLLIITYGQRRAITPSLPSGFTEIVKQTSGADCTTVAYKKIATGSESGDLSWDTGEDGSRAKIARMHRYSGADTVAATATSSASSKTIDHPDVVTTVADSLVLAVTGINDNETAASFTGETGGDFTLTFDDTTALGSDFGLSLQTAGMVSTGTISGGTWTYGGATEQWSTIGFAIFEAAAGGFTTVADSAAFTHTPQDASLEHGRLIDAESAAFAHSPQDANLEHGRVVNADSASFTHTPQDASLEHGRLIDAESAALVLSAQDVDLLKGATIDAESAAFAHSPQTVDLTHDYVMTADSAAFALGAQDVNLEHGRVIAADSASFAHTAQDVGLERGLKIVADLAAFVHTPQTVELTHDYFLTADLAAFVLTAQDVALIKGGTQITADSAAFAHTPQDVGLEHGRLIVADSAAFAHTPQDASLSVGRQLAADSAPFAHSPQDVGLEHARLMVADLASFAHSPQDVTLSHDHSLVVDSAPFTLAAQDVTLGRGMVADLAAFTLAAQDVDLRHDSKLTADSAAFAHTPQDVDLRHDRIVDAESAGFSLAVQDANLEHGRVILADSAAYGLTAQDVDLRHDYFLAADEASFVFTPQDVALLILGNLINAESAPFILTAQDVDLARSGGGVVPGRWARPYLGPEPPFPKTEPFPVSAGGFERLFVSASQIHPSLVLDYAGAVGGQYFDGIANTKTFDDMHTFARGSEALNRDDGGDYETAASGAHRLDHNKDGDPLGLLIEEARTNLSLWSDDWTKAAYNTVTNITPLKDQTGADGVANSASSLLATAANGVITQSITSGSATRVYSVHIKRLLGTGNIELTQDGGSTWLDIKALIDGTSFTQVATVPASVTNPVVGIRIVNDTDKIAVQYGDSEIGTFETSPIPTTDASVTRVNEECDVATSVFAWDDSKGSFYLQFHPINPDIGATIRVIGPTTPAAEVARIEFRGNAVGGSPILYEDQNNNVRTFDTIDPDDVEFKFGVGWATSGASVTYDGNTVESEIAPGANGFIDGKVVTNLFIGQRGNNTKFLNAHFKVVAQYPSRLPDADLEAITTP